jgi:hypothetical protein
MHDDYYQNILYPFQDKILRLIAELPVDFYLTGGTALSRAYLNHRYSDDLDFFVNSITDFKTQVNTTIKALTNLGFQFDISTADEGYARIFVYDGQHALKLDFINDVPFRCGSSCATPIFFRTDNLSNILSNKLTALGRYATKDVVDIIYIAEKLSFNWESILNDASEKDLWVNPISTAEVFEQFSLENLQEIAWIGEAPSKEWFAERIKRTIAGILNGSDNILKPIR